MTVPISDAKAAAPIAVDDKRDVPAIAEAAERKYFEYRLGIFNYISNCGARPYFDLVRTALGNLVDGEHFFDIISEDITYEVLYNLGGWPPVIEGKDELMSNFQGYCQFIKIHSADNLVIHQAYNGGVVVIEYQVHGTILTSGVQYNNRFCSIIKIESRKITNWRDYMDSLAAWNAITSPARVGG
jgi:ketosteroid isomerase-like protein